MSPGESKLEIYLITFGIFFVAFFFFRIVTTRLAKQQVPGESAFNRFAGNVLKICLLNFGLCVVLAVGYATYNYLWFQFHPPLVHRPVARISR